METKKLVKKLNEIEMPKEMQERIIENCYTEMEEKIMNKNTRKNYFKKPMVVAASLALGLCLTGITAWAAAGKLEGFFRDITGWNGAVIGTSYEQATDEMELKVLNVADELIIEVTMVKPNVAPYSVFELMGVEEYNVVDKDGNVIAEGKTTEMAEVSDGKVNINIPLENIAGGEYKLLVSKFVGSAKADQPLVISGAWECEFTK